MDTTWCCDQGKGALQDNLNGKVPVALAAQRSQSYCRAVLRLETYSATYPCHTPAPDNTLAETSTPLAMLITFVAISGGD